MHISLMPVILSTVYEVANNLKKYVLVETNVLWAQKDKVKHI